MRQRIALGVLLVVLGTVAVAPVALGDTPQVTVSARDVVGVAGDVCYVYFFADLSGAPDVDQECSATSVEWSWDDGTQGDVDVVAFQVPANALGGTVYPVTRTASVTFVSSCSPPISGGTGSGTGQVQVSDSTYCPG